MSGTSRGDMEPAKYEGAQSSAPLGRMPAAIPPDYATAAIASA